MIHPALLLLLRLRWRAMLRRTVRGMGTKRGAVLFILGLLLVLLWVAPAVFMSFRGERGDAEWFRAFVPLGMMAMCLLSLMTSVGERAIYFTPGEVEFLFPGPFSRREVLGFKLLGTVLNVTVMGLIFSLFVRRYVTYWLAAYLGVVLGLIFVQYFTIAALMVGESMSQRAFTRARKTIVFVGTALLAVAAGQVLAMRADARTGDILLLLRESPWLWYVLLPFEPFARMMTAQSLGSVGAWAAVCVAFNIILFAVIVLLDAEYRETAVRVSRRLHDRLQHAHRSGMAPAPLSAVKRRVPHLPWLGGAGPIVWRQTTNTVRNLRSIVMILILLTVAVTLTAAQQNPQQAKLTTLPLLAWLAIMLSMMIRFDFRNDIEQMDWLKVLPISPFAMALGQLLAPVMLCTLVITLLTGIVAYFLQRPEMVLVAFAFGLPTNLLLFATENTLFLMLPTRTAAFSPGDFQLFGRQLLFILVKSVVASLAWLIAVAGGALTSTLTGGNRIAGVAVAWFLLSAAAIALVPAVAWAYRRHDITADTPV